MVVVATITTKRVTCSNLMSGVIMRVKNQSMEVKKARIIAILGKINKKT